MHRSLMWQLDRAREALDAGRSLRVLSLRWKKRKEREVSSIFFRPGAA